MVTVAEILALIRLGLETAKAGFEFAVTPAGQKLVEEGIQDRKAFREWLEAAGRWIDGRLKEILKHEPLG